MVNTAQKGKPLFVGLPKMASGDEVTKKAGGLGEICFMLLRS